MKIVWRDFPRDTVGGPRPPHRPTKHWTSYHRKDGTYEWAFCSLKEDHYLLRIRDFRDQTSRPLVSKGFDTLNDAKRYVRRRAAQ